jgi:ribosomal protein L17
VTADRARAYGELLALLRSGSVALTAAEAGRVREAADALVLAARRDEPEAVAARRELLAIVSGLLARDTHRGVDALADALEAVGPA